MEVGIIVHTNTGHTGDFAQCIGTKLTKAGISYSYEVLKPIEEVRPRQKNVSFRQIPEIAEYDTLLIGGPVWGFTASPVVLAFLRQTESLKGKRALPFMTYGLPLFSFGARQALRTINRKLDALGATLLAGEAIWYPFGKPAKNMEEAADRITERITQSSK